MKPASRGNWYIAAAWLILLGGYIAICEWVPAGAARTSAANLLLCLMPLLVNGALLINAVTPDWRKRVVLDAARFRLFALVGGPDDLDLRRSLPAPGLPVSVQRISFQRETLFFFFTPFP